jgi:hypothetical protein
MDLEDYKEHSGQTGTVKDSSGGRIESTTKMTAAVGNSFSEEVRFVFEQD